MFYFVRNILDQHLKWVANFCDILVGLICLKEMRNLLQDTKLRLQLSNISASYIHVTMEVLVTQVVLP